MMKCKPDKLHLSTKSNADIILSNKSTSFFKNLFFTSVAARALSKSVYDVMKSAGDVLSENIAFYESYPNPDGIKFHV